LPSKQRLIQQAVSWLAVALGTLPGFYGLVMFCQSCVPKDLGRPDWLALWLQAAGLGILGLVFFGASLTALRNRRRAELSLLLAGPVVGFCLSFEDSYIGAPFRGYYWNRPSLPMAGLFACALFAPLYAPLIARNRKRAVYLFLILALLSGALFRFSPWSIVILPRLLEFSVPFLVFGAFWVGTDKLGWPTLTVKGPRSLPGRLALASLGCALVAILVFCGTLAVSANNSQPWDPDCGERQLFARPLNSEHAAFAARAIRVGHVTKISGRWAGNWAIGLVQERFWGLPWWSPSLVFLTTHVFWEGETYFIDGERDSRLVNRFLPIVEAGPCTHTASVAEAGIELRVLREGPSPGGVRILGRVEDHLHQKELLMETTPVPDWCRMTKAEILASQEQRRYSVLSEHRQEVYLPGARIRVAGSSASVIVTADHDGVFEAAGLPPDDYKLELLDVPAAQRAVNRTVKKEELIEKNLVWQDLYLYWNGSIEGRIRDLPVGLAELELEIGRADGIITPDSWKTSWTNDKGAFGFWSLPPGRYIVRINPNGPSDESPYAPQYYPFPGSREGAHVFEIAEGQHIRNVDFVLRRLDKRKLQVHVVWPDGRPADEADVHFAYEHTDQYDWGGGYEAEADHNGIADVTVFSGPRIRVWAEQRIGDGLGCPPARYSAGVELDTGKLPPRLDLVVSSDERPYR
jgi:hypothetical protein